MRSCCTVGVDRGRILVDEDADTLRGQAVTLSGPTAAVDKMTEKRDELHRERIGSLARSTLPGPFDAADRALAQSLGLEIEPVSLQQLIVRLTPLDKQTTLYKQTTLGKEANR